MTILFWILIVLGLITTGIFLFVFLPKFIEWKDGDEFLNCAVAFLIAMLFFGGSFFVHKKAEKQVAEANVKAAIASAKAPEDDKKLVESCAKELSLEDVLRKIKEPKKYVIAPMTYDTKKFAQDNSHEKGLLGENDYSAERLAVLEGCVTDFYHAVDELTGVSFLDRTKIAQIEKEHKFQLGDWSNEKKTAEVGKALNANVLLFLDKFAYIDSDYRFEAKFVDINTMQTSSFNIVYKNPKKKIVTPEVVAKISFRDFTAISTKDSSFGDELSLKAKGVFRTVQQSKLAAVSPFGGITFLEMSEYDLYAPKTEFMSIASLLFDGVGTVEVTTADEIKKYSYDFEPRELYVEKIGDDFYTDGKIGTLAVDTDIGYEKFDVYTINNREYYLHLGAAELPKVTVNYYLQMVKN